MSLKVQIVSRARAVLNTKIHKQARSSLTKSLNCPISDIFFKICESGYTYEQFSCRKLENHLFRVPLIEKYQWMSLQCINPDVILRYFENNTTNKKTVILAASRKNLQQLRLINVADALKSSDTIRKQV